MKSTSWPSCGKVRREKTVEQVCRERGIATPTYYGWKRKYGSMAEPDVKRLGELEQENARLKRILAERDVELDVVKEFLQKSDGHAGASGGGGVPDRARGFGASCVLVAGR